MNNAEREQIINGMTEEEAEKWFNKLPVRLTHTQAKAMFQELFDLGMKEKRKVDKKDMLKYLIASPWLGEDEIDLDAAITEMVNENPLIVQDLKMNKKDKALNAMVGMVMKK